MLNALKLHVQNNSHLLSCGILEENLQIDYKIIHENKCPYIANKKNYSKWKWHKGEKSEIDKS